MPDLVRESPGQSDRQDDECVLKAARRRLASLNCLDDTLFRSEIRKRLGLMKRKDADTRSTASDAELVVMRVLWEYGPGTVHEVVARLGQRKRAWAYNTVLTFLRRLVVKGYVSSETKAVAFQFAPRITREELIALRLRELARDLADGALSEIAAILALEMQADSRSQRARRSRVARKRTGTANSKS
ncbi:MAG: Penicillinase repressor, partial [Planctomycetota bacterium]